MSTDNNTHDDEAGKMLAEFVRRDGRVHRQSQRRYAIILDSRGWDHDRIAETLDIDSNALERLLALDGRRSCTECLFDRHGACAIVTGDAAAWGPCECACRE